MKIENCVVVVTGGASGLGEAVVRMLAAGGAKTVIADLNEAMGNALAAEVGGLFVRADVSKEEDANAVFDATEAKFGVANVMVNCAGIGTPEKTVGRDGTAQPLANFTKVVNVNLVGTFNMLSKFVARLHAQSVEGEERGVIINTASVAAFEGQIGQPAYAASKAGIVGMTLPLARELARYGIRVLTIAPGLFLTPLLKSLPEEAQASLGAQVPFPSRLGDPKEFAQLVQAIIENPMLNGETIRLDGAIRMGAK